MSQTASNATINFPANAYTTVNGSHDTINAGAGSYLTVLGSNNTVNAGSYSYVYVNGSSDVLNLGNHGDAILLDGTGIKVTLAFGHVNLDNNVTGAVLWGSYDFINLSSNAQINVHGSYDSIEAANGDALGLTAGSSNDNVTLTSGVLQTVNNVVGVRLIGSGDAVVLGATASANLAGNYIAANLGQSDNVTLSGLYNWLIGSNDQIIVADGQNNTLQISSSEILVDPGVGNLTIVGSKDTLGNIGIFASKDQTRSLASISSLNVEGSYNAVSLGTGSVVSLASGSNYDQIYADYTTVAEEDSVNGVTLIGYNDTVHGSNSDTTSIYGNANTADLGNNNVVNESGTYEVLNVGSASFVDLRSGNADRINMSNGTLDLAANVSNVALTGSNDTVIGIGDDSVNVWGISDTITLGEGSYVGVQAGATAAVTGTEVAVVLAGNYAAVAVSNDDNIIVLNGLTAGISGSNDIIVGTNDTINAGNLTNSNLYGSGDTVVFTGPVAESVGIIGTADTVVVNNSNDLVNIYANAQAVIDVRGAVIALLGNGASATADGTTVDIVSGITAAFSGTGDAINGTNDTLNAYNLTSSTLDGNGNTVNFTGPAAENIGIIGTGNTVNINNSNDQVNIYANSEAVINTRGAVIALLGNGASANANGTTVDITNGIAVTLNGTGDDINANNDTVYAANLINTNIYGNNDTVDLIGGSQEILGIGGVGDVVTNSNSGNYIGIFQNAEAYINGSGESVALTGNGAAVSAVNDFISVANGITVSISGGGDTIDATDDTINAPNLTSSTISGSGDTLNFTDPNPESVVLTGSAYTVNASNSGDYISISGGTDAVVNGSVEHISLLNNGASVITSGNTIGLATAITASVGGTGDVLYTASDVVNLNGAVGLSMYGSGDVVYSGVASNITLTGSNDTLNLSEGTTVTLADGDTGDTINMFGGTIILGNSLSGVNIVGTGDQLGGPGAGEAGPVTLASSVTTVKASSNGPVEITTHYPAYTPPVVYNAADIPDLLSYFAANPNLSMDQIAAAESDPNYETSLDAFLTSATLWGSPNSLSSNLLSMLDGYSSIYLAVLGINPQALSEQAYIEQQFNWVVNTYSDPSDNVGLPPDGLQTVIQNLLPTLLSTNPTVQSEVGAALNALEQGAAGAPQGNLDPLVDDTAAKLYLEAAENPTDTSFSDEVYTSSGSHYQVIVTEPGNNDSFQAKDQPLIEQVLSGINDFVTPLVDIAALIPSPYEAAFKVAALVLQTVQAGEDFETGDDLGGALNALGAIAGGITQYEQGVANSFEPLSHATLLPVSALESATDQELTAFGSYLSQAVATVQGIDGVVTGVQQDQISTAIASALGGIASLTGGNINYTDLHAIAIIGAGLASADVALTGGDILAAVAALSTAATDPSTAQLLLGLGVAFALNPDPNSPNYHQYTITDDIGSTSSYLIGTTQYLTAADVFQQLLNYAAPGQTKMAVDGQEQTLTGDNPIIQFVDPSTYTVTNVTLPGHVFDPGNVTRQVVEQNGEIYIITNRAGAGPDPLTNDVLGHIAFPSLDAQIKGNLLGNPGITH